jgi:DNA-binding transcriptional LysR family regulator
VLPRVFSTYKEKFPQVQLQVIRSYGSSIVEAVLDNSVDFGFTHLPVQERRLELVQVHTDEIRLLVPPSHALAQGAAVSAEKIVEYPLLLPKQGHTRHRIDEYLDLFEDQIEVSMELESSEMIKQFIIAGLGIGFMAVTNAQSEIRRGALAAVPLAPRPMIRTLGLIYRKDKSLSRAALGFIEVVVEFARRSSERTQTKRSSKGARRVPKAS